MSIGAPRRAAGRSPRLAICGVLVVLGCLAGAPSAPAQAPAINVHAIFSGGQTSGFTVGTVLQVQLADPSGQARVRQVCWSPAPIEQPACTPTGTGAPAQAGSQTITVQLTSGQSVSRTVPIGPAATQLPAPGSAGPPVPATVTCVTQLYGNPGGQDPLHDLTPGDRVAVYYRNGASYQVYDYSTNAAGFASARCVAGPTQRARTFSRTTRLRSNRTTTYRLRLPQGFQPAQSGTPIGYQLYIGNRRGSGVGNPIRARGGGVHLPFLGATVVRDGITRGTVFVRVRTTRLTRPITLTISAYGTAG